MRIDDIEIRNFRGFDKKTFTFDPAINVVVGNNTSGKTALLHAVQIALGAFFPALDLLPTANRQYRRNFSTTDVRRLYNIETYNSDLATGSPQITAHGAITDYIENIIGEPIATTRYIYWERLYKASTIDHGDLQPIVRNLSSLRRLKDQNSHVMLPLLLAFGTRRMNNDYKKVEKTQARESAVEKAYKNALLEKTDFSGAFDWIFYNDVYKKKGLVHDGTIEALFKAIKDAIPAIKEIDVKPSDKFFGALYQVTGLPTDYRTYEEMSDGFKSTIAIVAEIAYRSILLNGFKGFSAVFETPGVVLIDEVDLFLHPRWQRHILHDLRNAFPNIQFIVTTHSPFIIQSVQNKNLIILDGVKEPIDPSNMGLEDIAEALMGMKTRLRSQKYQDKFALTTKYYELVKEGHSKDADIMRIKQELDKLEQEKDLIDDPGLAALLKSERQGL